MNPAFSATLESRTMLLAPPEAGFVWPHALALFCWPAALVARLSPTPDAPPRQIGFLTGNDIPGSGLPESEARVVVARVLVARSMPDGGCRVLVRGESRGLLHGDAATEAAPVSLLPDHYPTRPVIDRVMRRAELLKWRFHNASQPDLHDQLAHFLAHEPPLGMICDLLAAEVQLSHAEASLLMAAIDVDQRSDLLLDMLRRNARTLPRPSGGSPPAASWN